MTKRKWRAELKRRAIEAQQRKIADEIHEHRRAEIHEMERRRLVGIKAIPAIGNDGNEPAVRTVFTPVMSVTVLKPVNHGERL